MIVVPLIPSHLEGLALQPGQDEMAEFIDQEGYGEMLSSLADSYCLIDDGIVKAVGGIADQGNGRALAWSLIGSKLCGTDLIVATRIVRRRLSEANYRRIEAIVKDGFDQGHRWAKMLGFSCETPNGMVNWFKDGRKAYLYARSAK